METETNDLLLVRQVQSGNKRAFDLLVAKYQYRVRGLVSRYLPNPADQDDMVQETFIKAYRSLANFRGDSAFYTWLYRIAVNTTKNHLKMASRRPQLHDMDTMDMANSTSPAALIETNTPESVMQNDQLVNAIRTAVEELPEELRQAITLREVEGMSYEDIAAIVECPVGTVRSRIHRARSVVQKAVDA